jgi:hypothetical protein
LSTTRSNRSKDAGDKTTAAASAGRFTIKTVAEVIGVAPNGRPPLPDQELAPKIKTMIGELPTYGY